MNRLTCHLEQVDPVDGGGTQFEPDDSSPSQPKV